MLLLIERQRNGLALKEDFRAAIALWLELRAQPKVVRTVAKLPVFVPRDGTGDQEISSGFHVGKQGLPGVLIQRLRRWKNRELRRAELGDLVFGDDVRSDVQAVGERANRFLLRFELQVGQDRKLRGLRGDDGDGGLTRILQMAVQRSCKARKITHHRSFGLFRSIRAQSADGRFVGFGHVGIGIPEPLNGARTLHKRKRDFAFEQQSFPFRRETRRFVQIDLALQPGLLNQHGLARLLGGERIPQQGIVPPPGMIGGEINRRAVKSGRQAIPHPAFVLADGDELLRAGPADFFAHGADPVQKRFLRK